MAGPRIETRRRRSKRFRFRFGGRLGLDLTWTLAYRHWAPTELLTSDDDVRDWLVAAGALPDGSPTQPDVLADARALREAIYASAHKRIRGERFRPADLDIINRWARLPRAAPQFSRTGKVLWVADRPIEAALAAVAVDAIDVLNGPQDRLRECMREDCAALFFDGSRPGQRRWCSLDVCGNAVNTARYRAKKDDRA